MPGPAEPAARKDQKPRDHGQHDDDQQGEPPVDEEDEEEHPDEGDGVEDQLDEGVGDEVLERRHVAGDAAHQFADPGGVQRAQRHALHVVVEHDPDIHHDALPDVVHQVLPPVERHGLEDEEQDDGDADQVQGEQVSGDQDVVDHALEEPGGKNVEPRGREHEKHRSREAVPVGSGVGGQPTHGAGVLCRHGLPP